MVDYYQLTRNTLSKAQTLDFWPQIEAACTRLAAARVHEASLKEIADLEDCNGRLE